MRPTTSTAQPSGGSLPLSTRGFYSWRCDSISDAQARGVCVKATLPLFLWALAFAGSFSARSAQTPPPSNEQRWKADHEAGLKALEQELYSQAVRSFEVAIGEAEKFGSTDARLAQSISGMGQAYLLQGNFAAAERQFQQALA